MQSVQKKTEAGSVCSVIRDKQHTVSSAVFYQFIWLHLSLPAISHTPALHACLIVLVLPKRRRFFQAGHSERDESAGKRDRTEKRGVKERWQTQKKTDWKDVKGGPIWPHLRPHTFKKETDSVRLSSEDERGGERKEEDSIWLQSCPLMDNGR